MFETIKKWGSIGILSTTGGTLVAMLIMWLFGTSYRNTIILAPLVQAVDNLADVTSRADIRNVSDHKLIVDKLYKVSSHVEKNEVILFRVVDDCKKNSSDIRQCQLRHAE